MKFQDMEYVRPDIDATVKKLDNLKNKISKSNNADEQISAILELNEMDRDLSTYSNLSNVKHSIDTNNEFYEKENDFWNQNGPILGAKQTEIYEEIVNSKYLKELNERFGKQFIENCKSQTIINDSVISLCQKENDLITKYSKIIANSQIEVNGSTYTISQMAPLLEDTSRDKRKTAYEALNSFFEKHIDEFDNIYDELVKVRVEIANKLGYKNYVELQYKLLNRTDYDSEAVAKYREKVLKEITPIAVKLRKKQAERLGLDELKFYDRALHFKDGNSKPQGDYSFIIKNAQKMYRELSPETGEFFDFMVENDLMDLVAKKGKRAGGFCTNFPKYKAPFIFSNFNGTLGDIDVITHEAGHAFQNYMSRNIEMISLIWPTYEACEIHSMSMEFLTWPWMNLFFGENEKKYKYTALESAITFIPYGVTIDHFQHFVYENPNATPEERRQKFHELELMYQPDINYDNDFLNKGTYWFRQGHVFSTPFYYIDYTLAQVCAFQYLLKYLDDKEKTLKEYIELCKAGGTQSFFGLVELGKIKNPMTTNVIEEALPKLEKLLDSIL